MRNVLHYTANALLVAGIAGGYAVSAVTHTAPEASYSQMTPSESYAYAQVQGSKSVNVPTFATHGQPGCAPVDGKPADVVLVVTQQSDTQRMAFDAAWTLGEDGERANGVWTVGVCR